MTQEFINRMFAVMLGKCWHEWEHVVGQVYKCSVCKRIAGPEYRTLSLPTWSPSLDGEVTKEVRDWFTKEMPEEWEKYIFVIFDRYNYAVEIFNAQLSITNLAQFIMDNYREMFYEKCKSSYAKDFPDCQKVCNILCDESLIVKPQYAEAVRIIEGGLKWTKIK